MKALRYTLYFALLLVAIDQIVYWGELSDGYFGARRLAPFDPPMFGAAQRTSLMQIDAAASGDGSPEGGQPFDAELGWAPRAGGRDRYGAYDAQGARDDGSPLLPARSPERLRILALGCSFTHGASCAPQDTWPARLEALRPDELEVANLGVVGYGVDQALLRARRELQRLQPDEVWLGWCPDTTLRITTLYPPALDHGRDTVAFKPRFTLQGEALALLPCPARSAGDFMRLCTDQDAFLRAVQGDDWVQRTPRAWASFGSDWRHRCALTRMLLTVEEQGDREPEPYLADRATPVARLLRALVADLAQSAAQASARFRLIVLPDRRDLRWRQRTGLQGYWSDTLVLLADQGIETLDASPALESVGAPDGSGLWLDDGQYGPRLNAAVAEFLAERITRGAPIR